MPTARELLQQADALMRRNRGGDGGIPVLTESVPEEAPVSSRGPVTRERPGISNRDQVADARAPREKSEREGNGDGERSAEREGDVREAKPAASTQEGLATQAGADAAANDAEPPILTDVVDEIAFIAQSERPERSEGEPSLWLGADTIDPALHSITGPAPDTVGVVPPVIARAADARAESPYPTEESDPTAIRTLRAAGSEPTPPPTASLPPDNAEASPPGGEAVAPAPEAPPAGGEAAAPAPEAPRADGEAPAPAIEAPRADDKAAEPAPEAPRASEANEDERWRALSEQVSMQVLQRLDLFIDSGLKSQLASHLQPIVVRASAELVEAINDHVGQLVRTYVAEAIEREIAQWRKQQE